MSFDIPEHLLYSLMSPNMRSNYLIAEFHVTGHKRIVSLGWCPIPVQGLTSKPVERNTPIYRGTPRVLLALEPPFDLPQPTMTPISGAALSFRLSTESNGISDLSQFFHSNTFLNNINPVYPVLNQVTLESIQVSFCNSTNAGKRRDSLESKLAETIAALYHRSLPSGDSTSSEDFAIQEKRLCIGLHNQHKFVGKVTRVFAANESLEDGSLVFADVFLSDVFVDPTLTLLVWMEYQVKHTWIVAGWGMIPTTRLPQYSDSFRIDLHSTTFLPDRLSFSHESTFLTLDTVIEVYGLPPSPSKPKPAAIAPPAPTIEPPPKPDNPEPSQPSHQSLADHESKGTIPASTEQLEDGNVDPTPSKPIQPDPPLDSGILYPRPEPRSLLGLSRSHLARLLSARFPLSTALSPTERPGNTSLDAESRDTRTVNRISLLFLAFAPATASRMVVPDHVRLDFTFYTFAPVSTTALLLAGADPADRHAPTVLQHLDAPYDGHLEQYTVDVAEEIPAAGLHSGPHSVPPSSFAHYLSTSSLAIHVWDVSTGHFIGRGQVPLSGLLRHGRGRSTEVHAVPIGDPHVGSNAVLGTLYLTMENLGELPSSSDGGAGVRLTWADIFNTRYSTNRVGDFRQHLARRNKIAPMVAKLTQSVDVDQSLPLGERRQRYKCLVGEIQASRERCKFSEITKRIRGEMTTHYQGHVMFGCSHFFHFSFSNPKASDSLYRLVIDEPNLRVLTHEPEICFFSSNGRDKPVVHSRNNQLELLVHPLESVAIPLLFTSVEAASEIRGSVSILDVHTGNAVARLECAFFIRPAPVHNHMFFHASANEYFRCSIPMGNVLTTNLAAMGGLVTSSPIELSTGSQALSAAASKPTVIASVQCFDSDVYCGVDASSAAIQLKLRAPRDPPSTRQILVYAYADMFAHQLVGVVRVTIRATQRVEVVGHLGQLSTVALTVPPNVVRSAGHRLVTCYKSPLLLSSGSESTTLKVACEGSIALSHGSFEVKYSPDKVGDESQVVNLVDTATKELIWAWTLHCQSLAPLVTKTFQLTLPLHRSISKRISFTNPYRLAKVFHVSTSHPNLVAIREDVFELSATGTIYLHLTFTHMDSPVHVDVYIYINDHEGNAEECFCIQADYKADVRGSGARLGPGGLVGASAASIDR
ncbi:hypothetical protein BCR44DRAFT_1172192 [Catenaria anguillulae PL171]|uniref:Nephrocystin-4 n=1 Tax=Catenaria anguillulae PL171 TaxID=765915 RepID=A0A1Y2I0C8_9FUNG|nr:hypothetical protein BCR44DRAFT_1172192 [Catenaria anguillulae PL171]